MYFLKGRKYLLTDKHALDYGYSFLVGQVVEYVRNNYDGNGNIIHVVKNDRGKNWLVHEEDIRELVHDNASMVHLLKEEWR